MRCLIFIALTFVVCRAEVQEKHVTEQSFTLPAGARKIIVDNVFGSVNVAGRPGDQVLVKVNELWTADDTSRMAEARRDIKIDMRLEGGILKLIVDGPFRCNCGGVNFRGDTGYRFNFDFDVQVPQDSAVELRTVNKGKITARNIGDFKVNNVNGAIDLGEVAGSGSAHTVNGPITVRFRENPHAASSFKTINGHVEVVFQPDLSAELRVKTLHGNAYTDFDVTGLPATGSVEKTGGKFLYRSNRSSRMRAGAGGPEHSFEILNGEIRILKEKK